MERGTYFQDCRAATELAALLSFLLSHNTVQLTKCLSIIAMHTSFIPWLKDWLPWTGGSAYVRNQVMSAGLESMIG